MRRILSLVLLLSGASQANAGMLCTEFIGCPGGYKFFLLHWTGPLITTTHLLGTAAARWTGGLLHGLLTRIRHRLWPPAKQDLLHVRFHGTTLRDFGLPVRSVRTMRRPTTRLSLSLRRQCHGKIVAHTPSHAACEFLNCSSAASSRYSNAWYDEVSQ